MHAHLMHTQLNIVNLANKKNTKSVLVGSANSKSFFYVIYVNTSNFVVCENVTEFGKIP